MRKSSLQTRLDRDEKLEEELEERIENTQEVRSFFSCLFTGLTFFVKMVEEAIRTDEIKKQQ